MHSDILAIRTLNSQTPKQINKKRRQPMNAFELQSANTPTVDTLFSNTMPLSLKM